MTRFKDALTEAAEQAPPLDDIADRALAESRRRRLRVGLPLAAVSVAATAALIAGVAAWLPAGNSPTDVTTGPDQDVRVPTGTVQFPERAKPLPDKGVGPVALTYSMTCDEQANASQCQWRVMTADGQHWTVPDAAHPDGSEGLADRGTMTVSPDGERIGYFRAGGTFVLRSLETGKIEQAHTWKPDVLDAWPDIIWSPNGQWLAVSHADESILVDTNTMRTTKLPDPEARYVFGVRDNGEPLYAADVPKRLLKSADGAQGSLSPDGSTLAAITFPKWKKQLNVIDIDEERLVGTYPIERGDTWDQPTFIGWSDASTALTYTFDLTGPSDSTSYRYPGNVHAVDVRTGKLSRVFHLPDDPRSVSVAAGLIGGR